MHIVRQIIDIIIVAEDKIATKVMSLMLKSLTGFFLVFLLLNANSAIFQLYHGENKLIFNEMMMRSALYYTLMWIFIVLAH